MVHAASPFGIPVRLHWSFLALLAGFLGYGLYRFGPYGAMIIGIGSIGLVLSVTLHELGHALAARRFGIATRDIVLYPFGGVASIEGMPEDPDQEIPIALAGPAVNVVLAAIGGAAYQIYDHPVIMSFVASNLLMGLFNLIPAYPMDGGRVLRSLLAKWLGWDQASRMSIRIGRVFAWVFIGVGLSWQHVSLLMMGVFLHVALNAEKARLVARFWERTTGNPAWWTADDSGSASACLVPR